MRQLYIIKDIHIGVRVFGIITKKNQVFFIHRYRSVIHREGDRVWTSRLVENGDVVDYEDTYFEAWGYGEDDVKEQFLKAKIFDGKSFWDVEKESAWYDEGQSFINLKKCDYTSDRYFA